MAIYQRGRLFAANNIRYGNSVGEQTPTRAFLEGVPGNRLGSGTNKSTTNVDLTTNANSSTRLIFRS
jgi:hypothetical protein